MPSNEVEFFENADEIAARIPDGALLGLPPDYSMPAMAVVHALIRRNAKNLKLLGVPVLGLSADLLIGAGCVAEVESSAVSLGEAGLAPRFTEAVEKKLLKVRDATCPAIHSALQATEKGVPFMPLRGVIGSDLVALRPDWKVIENPLKENDPILLVPAIEPDVALFHARWADEAGNVWIGRRKELATIAHASRRCFVTCEEVRPGDMLEDELLAPGVLSSVYVSGVARAERGAWPLAVAGVYGIDDSHLERYAKSARTREGFQRYLDEHVWRLAQEKSSSPAASRA
ncbi:MAG: CoA synthetase [Candidatus Parcubacteria bacterium]|nr:CoA synthetase [Burkholderiales bacterium]